jgi:hypothetical protein
MPAHRPPTHPRRAAFVLMACVVAAVVVLALLSTFASS